MESVSEENQWPDLAIGLYDSEQSPFQQEDHEFGRMGVESFSDAFVDTQTDHLDLIERENELLLKDSPPRELEAMMFDEASRTPPPIKSASYGDLCVNRQIPCPTSMSQC